MRKLIVACVGLIVCITANLATPRVAAAAKFSCTECESGDTSFCPAASSGNTYCGAAAWYCDGSGWDIECVYAGEDWDCPDPCDAV